jgi:hypothetical protein
LDGLLLLVTLQLVAFCGVLVAFTAAYSIKVFVSGYQSIDMHCIVSPVKFDSGLFMSVLRNKQLFKKWKSKVHIFKTLKFLMFQTPAFGKGQTLEKSYFFGSHFSCERDGRPNFKFGIDSEVLFIYQLIPR